MMRLALSREGRSSMKEQIAQLPRSSHAIPRRASAYTPVRNIPEASTQQHIFVEQNRLPSLVPYFLLGMTIVLVGLILWRWIVLPWWAGVSDQWRYGDARITRFRADVGHGGTSTFIAFDLDGSVMIIEMPGGNIAEAKLYRTANLIGADADHRIVTLSIVTVDGVRDCLIVHVEGATSDIVLYNNGSSFQWTQPK